MSDQHAPLSSVTGIENRRSVSPNGSPDTTAQPSGSATPDDRTGWLDLLAHLQPDGIVVIVGQPDDRLVERLKQVGCEVVAVTSLLASSGEKPVVPGEPTGLPFPDGSVDVVVLADLLEQLPHPTKTLAEAARILKPRAFIMGRAQDPTQATAPAQVGAGARPPSFWLRELERLGLSALLRFFGEPSNFQFLAAPGQSPTLPVFPHQKLDENRPEIIEMDNNRSLSAAFRSGWGPLQSTGRAFTGDSAAVYLVNTSPAPLSLKIRIDLQQTPHFSNLRVRLDSQVLAELSLDSEQPSRVVEADDVLLPSGGHHLFFDVFPGGPALTLQRISLSVEHGSSERLTLTLPFDLFQRYQLCADAIRVLNPTSILDVGGFLGDENGHLAVSHDFFLPAGSSPPKIAVTDFRQCDHPDCLKALAWQQPFPDSSFDLVVSLDVLEHLSSEDRNRYLQELDRLASRWILVGAPFASAAVEAAERSLAEGLMSARRFLQEHHERGLPERRLVEEYARGTAYELLAFPNGYLPRWCYWQVLTQHYFALNDYEINRTLQSLYNQRCYPDDNREPAYRTIYLISKQPLTAEQRASLSKLTVPGQPAGLSPLEALGSEPGFLAAHNRAVALLEARRKALTDAQFLANARQEYIELLLLEIKRLTPAPNPPHPRWQFWRKR